MHLHVVKDGGEGGGEGSSGEGDGDGDGVGVGHGASWQSIIHRWLGPTSDDSSKPVPSAFAPRYKPVGLDHQPPPEADWMVTLGPACSSITHRREVWGADRQILKPPL